MKNTPFSFLSLSWLQNSICYGIILTLAIISFSLYKSLYADEGSGMHWEGNHDGWEHTQDLGGWQHNTDPYEDEETYTDWGYGVEIPIDSGNVEMAPIVQEGPYPAPMNQTKTAAPLPDIQQLPLQISFNSNFIKNHPDLAAEYQKEVGSLAFVKSVPAEEVDTYKFSTDSIALIMWNGVPNGDMLYNICLSNADVADINSEAIFAQRKIISETSNDYFFISTKILDSKQKVLVWVEGVDEGGNLVYRSSFIRF